MPTDCETISAVDCGNTGLNYSEALNRFEQAIAAYKAQADPLTLLLLNKSAIPLMDAQTYSWMSVDDPQTLSTERPFTAVRVLCDRRLGADQIERFAGCLGYALQATLAGPELSLPEVILLEASAKAGVRASFTLVEFTYDAALSGRTTPDYADAFVKTREYIRDGTPVRATNKAGAGTQGTRLVEGLGTVGLSLYVR